MTQAIVASLPVGSRWVSSCLESIIDKKVRGVALNFFEKIVDWVFIQIYRPYNSLYKAKMARVHTFSDGSAKLFDASKQKVAGIDFEFGNDFITVKKKRVLFNPNPNIEPVFSREAFTDYIVVKDDEKRRPGWFEIIEQEIARPGNPKPMGKSWMVNTNQRRIGIETYLVEQPRPE